MSKYTISCSSEQVEKSLKLGAEEEYLTAEEMIGWLDDQGILIDVHFYCISWDMGVRTKTGYIVVQKMAIDSREEATLTAINAALEYLSNKK